MDNDLISREALKEHKFVGNKYVQIGGRTNGKTLENINKAYQQGWNDAIDSIIDNAPTVELQMGRMTNGIIIPVERPQGKWIMTGSIGNGNAHYICSNCLYGDEQAESQEVPYCWHCGAYMRKAREEK